MNITTTFERRENDIVANAPDHNKPVILVDLENLSPLQVDAALRRAYAMGRQDERRQTAAVLRGLLGE